MARQPGAGGHGLVDLHRLGRGLQGRHLVASQRDKVIARKPAAAVDGCWSNPTTFVAETQTLSSQATTTCNTLFPTWTFPRHVAGGPVSANIPKCSLKPANAADYTVPSRRPKRRAFCSCSRSACATGRKAGNRTGVVTDGSFGPSSENLVFNILAP